MELTERKKMRLGSFDYGTAGCYFVTICTQNRAQVFSLEGAGQRCAANLIVHNWVAVCQSRFPGCRVEKYAIMPDHVHLLVCMVESNWEYTLSDVMHFLKTMTTNEYIQRVKTGELPPFDKKLWQKSYYDHVVRNQQDYNEIWEYIENNPSAWLEKHK